jgi:hypothetical protein
LTKTLNFEGSALVLIELIPYHQHIEKIIFQYSKKYLTLNYDSSFNPNDTKLTVAGSFVYTLSALTTFGSDHWPSKFGSQIAALSLLVFGLLVWNMWEAMLVSYLSSRRITPPFMNVQTMMDNTDYGLILRPSTFFENAFELSKDPLWQRAYKERYLPVKETVPKEDLGSAQNISKFLAKTPKLAWFTTNYA